MCFDYDATPPALPVDFALSASDGPSGTPSTERMVLTSADGTKFAAYLARPTQPTGAGIVILPDVRGLFRFYEDLAERFASAGVTAIAFDYFGRTAGLGPRDAEFEYMPHVMQTKPETVAQDVHAAAEVLRGLGPQSPTAIFTVGFCFGGTQSLHQASNHYGLAGVIAFYGSPTSNRFGSVTPIDRIAEVECPILALYGGADPGIPVADVERYDAALTAAGKTHSIHVYPDAPHSFFDRKQAEFSTESEDSWRRILSFIQANTK